MIQEIITYLILLVTITITINKIAIAFKNTSGACSGCANHENGCKIAAIKGRVKIAK